MSDEKLSSNVMSLQEYTAVIMFRAKELDQGSFPLISNDLMLKYGYDPVKIAKHEIDHKMLSINIVRELSGGVKETRNVRELERFI